MPKTKDLFIYGIIGNSYSEDATQALSFINELKKAENESDIINIRINSPGGSMNHGMPIFNAIKNSTKEIHIYNDGIAYSMAAVLFFAVPRAQTHGAKNSLFLLHNSSVGLMGDFNAGELNRISADIEKFDNTLIQSIANRTELNIDEIKTKYFDFNDHLFTAQEANDLGFVNLENFEGEIPSNISNMTFKEVMDSFKKPENTRNTGFLSFFKNIINKHENNQKPVKMFTIKNAVNLLTVFALSQFETNASGKVEMSPDDIFKLENHINALNQQLEVANQKVSAIETKNAELVTANNVLTEKIGKVAIDVSNVQVVADPIPSDDFSNKAKLYAHNQLATERI